MSVFYKGNRVASGGGTTNVTAHQFTNNVSDIKPDGASASLGVLDTIVRADHVHPITIATLNSLGVVKPNKALGTSIDANGNLSVETANPSEIASRTSQSKVIYTGNLNNAVKAALTDSNHLTMDETEKATAQEVLGINVSIKAGSVPTAIIANDLSGNIASSEYCFAEGRQNHATGVLGSHAEGYLNTASGSHSHAEGEENVASGQNSHAEGWHNTASAYSTHVEGGRNNATFEYAHAEGQFTTANGFASHSEGCQTTTGIVARQSHAEGYYTEAYNYQSHAEGDYSIAGFNDDTVATFDITASYTENTIVKNNTGLYYLCVKATTGNDLDNTTYWNLIESNHAEGKNTRSTSVASHSEGINSIASGKASHAEGNGTFATNNSAHSEGTGSTASGKYSHAEGLESVASGSRSHAEGYTTTASGDSAHAQGRDTLASGKYSFAGGRGTTASKENQTALGQYNATDNEALFIVGTGSSSSARNSFAAGHDGTESFIKVGSTKFRESEIAKKSDLSEKLEVIYDKDSTDATINQGLTSGVDFPNSDTANYVGNCTRSKYKGLYLLFSSYNDPAASLFVRVYVPNVANISRFGLVTPYQGDNSMLYWGNGMWNYDRLDLLHLRECNETTTTVSNSTRFKLVKVEGVLK